MFVAASLGSYWHSRASDWQDEHVGRCPSHLAHVQDLSVSWENFTSLQFNLLHSGRQAGRHDRAGQAYLDLRTRQALHARPTRRRLLAGGAGSGSGCGACAWWGACAAMDICTSTVAPHNCKDASITAGNLRMQAGEAASRCSGGWRRRLRRRRRRQWGSVCRPVTV